MTDHSAGASADGVVDEEVETPPRFTSAEDALANVSKIAGLRASAVAQVEHLEERLATAIEEAVEAGAKRADAKAAAKNTETREGDNR